jgi:hypothetical protein
MARVNKTAHLVGFIDTESGTLRGVGVFSEETPSFGVKLFPFTIVSGYGEDFQEGLDELRSTLVHEASRPMYGWAVKLLGERDKQVLGL